MTSTVAIKGNTYPVKDAIKALGGRWNPEQKCWMVSEDKASAARALVAGSPAKRALSSSSYARGTGTCSHCGDRCNPKFRTCYECANGGQSYTDSRGNFVLGSDD